MLFDARFGALGPGKVSGYPEVLDLNQGQDAK